MAVWVYIKDGESLRAALIQPEFLQNHLSGGWTVDKKELEPKPEPVADVEEEVEELLGARPMPTPKPKPRKKLTPKE